MRPLPVSLLDWLAPPLCTLCAATAPHPRLVCSACERELSQGMHGLGLKLPGADAAWAAAPYEGAARRLVTALKFRARLRLAKLAAELIAANAPAALLRGAIVPVPAAPWRRRWRGFDPAELIATELARRARLPLALCLRRSSGPRQVGRGRAARRGAPPAVRAAPPVPAGAVLVDDVITTRATMEACVAALRSAGAERVVAIGFAVSL